MSDVFDDPELNPRVATRAAPMCRPCAESAKRAGRAGEAAGVPAYGFERSGGKIIPLCRMHGGMNAPISIRDGMAEWIAQDILES